MRKDRKFIFQTFMFDFITLLYVLKTYVLFVCWRWLQPIAFHWDSMIWKLQIKWLIWKMVNLSQSFPSWIIAKSSSKSQFWIFSLIIFRNLRSHIASYKKQKIFDTLFPSHFNWLFIFDFLDREEFCIYFELHFF